jgi:rubrerythrin
MESRVKHLYYESLRHNYHQGTKKTKSKLLTQHCKEEELHRKTALRLLSKKTPKKSASVELLSKAVRGRKSKYTGEEFGQALRKLWRVTNWMGSKALTRAIPEWLPFYEKHYGQLSDDTREKLLKISVATIDRRLKHFKKTFAKGKCGTKPGTLLRNEIPIRAGVWNSILARVCRSRYRGTLWHGNRSPDWLETALFFDFFQDSPIYCLANGAYSNDDTTQYQRSSIIRNSNNF